jgi:inorganic pyrophosphatase
MRRNPHTVAAAQARATSRAAGRRAAITAFEPPVTIDVYRGLRLDDDEGAFFDGCGPRGMNLQKVSPLLKGGLVRIVVETPKGSRNKLDYDPELKAFVLAKTLPEGMVFPYDFGVIPQTRGADGDPLDALVLMPETLPPGCLVACRLLGVIEATQAEGKGKGVRNDRYLAVSDAACEFHNLKTPDDLPAGMLEQLEKFFVNYNALEGRTFRLRGVTGPKGALKAIRRAQIKA